MKFPTQLYGDFFINHEIRISALNNQSFMESYKVKFQVGEILLHARLLA